MAIQLFQMCKSSLKRFALYIFCATKQINTSILHTFHIFMLLKENSHFVLQIKQEHSTYHGDVPSGVAFRRFWFIHIGHTSMNHSCILLNLVKLIIISGMLWNKHTRCSILEYQLLVNTKFSLAHGY